MGTVNCVTVTHEYRGEMSGTKLTSTVKELYDGLPKPTGAHSQHPAAASEAAPTARSRWSLEKRQEDNKLARGQQEAQGRSEYIRKYMYKYLTCEVLPEVHVHYMYYDSQHTYTTFCFYLLLYCIIYLN